MGREREGENKEGGGKACLRVVALNGGIGGEKLREKEKMGRGGRRQKDPMPWTAKLRKEKEEKCRVASSSRRKEDRKRKVEKKFLFSDDRGGAGGAAR